MIQYITRKLLNIVVRFQRLSLKIEKFFLEKKKVKDADKLKAVLLTKKIVKLHIGCGARVLKDWINIDLHYEPYENYLKYFTDVYYPESMRGDKSEFYSIDVVKEGLPLPDNSVDVIFHEDFIEHLTQKEQVAFLAETLRVLKKGGVHRINTPNLLYSMKAHSNFSLGMKGVYFQEWDRHGHFNVITPDVIKELALMVGYSDVKINTRDNSTSNLIPKEYRPDPTDRPTEGNVFADLIK